MSLWHLLTKRTDRAANQAGYICQLPTVVRQRPLAVNAAHYQRYRHFVAWPKPLQDYFHPAYLQMLMMRMQTDLLCHSAQPFALLGLVHVDNDWQYQRLLAVTEEATLAVSFDQAKPHRKGWLIPIHNDVSVAGQRIMRATSTYLARAHQPDSYIEHPPLEQALPTQQISEFTAERQTGFDYARLSLDFNPIHLSKYTARWFGFRQAIAHGMWSLARTSSCLYQYRLRAEAVDTVVQSALHWQGKFVRPIFLPKHLQVLIEPSSQSGQWPSQVSLVATDSQSPQVHFNAQLTPWSVSPLD